MTEFAIYGKGGIGKSTISANLSAALAKKGRRVLQIGCDPKHDSTRLLLQGARPVTVLDYIRDTGPDKCRLEDIVSQGAFGVHCLEAGGPEPGVGCAGRGILSTFELIGRLGIKAYRYDAILYDVLGDVVCGGFAVPIRREYAKKVYIVTSGEFMALYAANNILRGLRSYDQNLPGRAGGIIFNSRALGEEDGRIRRFCEAVGLPLLESFPRSDLFSACEEAGQTLVEGCPGSELAEKFLNLAEKIESQGELYPACPLSDEELEERILGRERKSAVPRPPVWPEKGQGESAGDDDENAVPAGGALDAKNRRGLFSKSLMAREPLMGCAFNGAMGVTTQVAEAVTVAHGPRSCAHIAYQSTTSISRHFLLARGTVLPYTSAPPVFSSDMSEKVMIFGGMTELRARILELKARFRAEDGGETRQRLFFVLTACPSGIIGDNVSRVMDLEDEHTTIVPIETDGNMTGDYLQGIFLAHFEIARALIDRNVPREENTVNIVAEKPKTYALNDSFNAVREILGHFGIRVNCRFICETTVEELRGFMRGKLNLLAWNDYKGRTIRTFLEDEYGAEFFDEPFPVGFRAASRYTRRLGEYFGRSEGEIAAVIGKFEKSYREEIRTLRPHLEGKRVMIVTITQNIDWVLQTILDTGMIIAFVGIRDYSQEDTFTTELGDAIEELSIHYDAERRKSDAERVRPDLFLSPFPAGEMPETVFQDTLTYSPEAGFAGALDLARRWASIFSMNMKEGWRNDESLFRKYYA